jgi:uncharacterized protein YjbI with pentapeptide repeats
MEWSQTWRTLLDERSGHKNEIASTNLPTGETQASSVPKAANAADLKAIREAFENAANQRRRRLFEKYEGVASDLPPLQTQGAPSSPPIATKADDLEAIQKAVEDASVVGGGVWLSYIFVLFYLAVAAGQVTHIDLLLQSPVKLPFLNIEFPLLAFFFIAPLIFLISHAYTLIHFVLLAVKTKAFHRELRSQIADSPNNPTAADVRKKLRQRLPSDIFVQFLAGPENIRGGVFGSLLKLIWWMTLVVGPIALLLLFQIQFLPYHDPRVTWTHRILLLIDLALVWWLWRKILSGRDDLRGWRSRKTWAKTSFALVPTAFVFVVSWFVATIPGEWRGPPYLWLAPIEPVSFNKWLFSGEVNSITRRRTSWFSNTLVLPGLNIYEALKIDDPKKLEWREHIFDLRGRHLEGALFYGANLTKVDLTGASLQDANLQEAQLQGASLYKAEVQGASLYKTQLPGSNLREAQLQGVNLYKAQLQGADLGYAQLQGARLGAAQLQGASFYKARLQGSDLREAQLQGVNLYKAQLQGADLREAQQQGAALRHVKLQGANLFAAQLQGADLRFAKLQGAKLFAAQLQGADLSEAELQGADLGYAQLQGALLRATNLNAVNISNAFLWRTQFDGSKIGMLHAQELQWKALAPLGEGIDGLKGEHYWTQEDYEVLRQRMDKLVAPDLRNEPLKRLELLDCEKIADNGLPLAPCDPKAQEPDSVSAARRMMERASVSEQKYQTALAEVLGALVCEQGGDAIYILRGLLRGRIQETGAETAKLITRIATPDCPAAASLTESDKAMLGELWKKAHSQSTSEEVK